MDLDSSHPDPDPGFSREIAIRRRQMTGNIISGVRGGKEDEKIRKLHLDLWSNRAPPQAGGVARPV